MASRRSTRLARATDAWLAAAVALVLRGLALTWRARVEGEDPFASGRPFVAALWHRGLFVTAALYRDRGAVIPVSRSRDGDRIDAVLARLGFGPSPRGSSSRGGVGALAGLIRAVRAGHAVGVLCDGPRGPARHAKPGALAAARASGAPLVPVGVEARPGLRFGSWDRVVLPLPFARVACVFGPTLHVARDAAREELEASRQELERRLERAEQRARVLVGAAPATLAIRSGDGPGTLG